MIDVMGLWGVVFVLSCTLFLANCASPGYVKYVKPLTDKIRFLDEKLTVLSKKYRDPDCITADCQWQRDADENAE